VTGTNAVAGEATGARVVATSTWTSIEWTVRGWASLRRRFAFARLVARHAWVPQRPLRVGVPRRLPDACL
jgi:hypothetical protein